MLGLVGGHRGDEDAVLALSSVDRRGDFVSAISWHESRTRSTSSKLRPVLIGEVTISLIFLSGPMTNAERTVALSVARRPLAVPLAAGWIMSVYWGVSSFPFPRSGDTGSGSRNRPDSSTFQISLDWLDPTRRNCPVRMREIG